MTASSTLINIRTGLDNCIPFLPSLFFSPLPQDPIPSKSMTWPAGRVLLSVTQREEEEEDQPNNQRAFVILQKMQT